MNRADVVCPMHIENPSPTCPTCQFLTGQPVFNRADTECALGAFLPEAALSLRGLAALVAFAVVLIALT